MTDGLRKHYLKIISDVWCWDCDAKNCETCDPAPSGYFPSSPTRPQSEPNNKEETHK